jgi:hypothetical protein
MAQKWHKKMAQSRPSSSLCHFFIETGNARLFPYYHEILRFSRKNGVIAPKIRAKTVNLDRKRQKYRLLTPT